MYIRKRADNISLERAIYEPAIKDPDGKTIVKPARRSTQYLGSLPANTRYSAVPAELLDLLTLDERVELVAALRVNEPTVDAAITALPDALASAGRELIALAQRDKSPEGQAALKARWHELEAAWAALQHDAQTAGLRRTVRRKPAPQPAAPAAE